MGKRRKKKKKNQSTTSDPKESAPAPESEKPNQMRKRHKMELREFETQTKVLVKRAGKEGKERKREVQRERKEQKKALENSHQEQLKSLSEPSKTEESSVMDDLFASREEIEREKKKKRHLKMVKKREEEAEKDRKHMESILESQKKLNEKGGTKGQIELKEITKKLAQLSMRIHSVPADGDCLYSSVAHQLSTRYEDKKNAKDIRRTCAFNLRKNKKEYEGFVSEDFEEYCKKIEMTSEWGGHLELRSISEGMNLFIQVYQAEGDVISIGEEAAEKVRKIHVSYHKYLYSTGEHYNSVASVEEEGEED